MQPVDREIQSESGIMLVTYYWAKHYTFYTETNCANKK